MRARFWVLTVILIMSAVFAFSTAEAATDGEIARHMAILLGREFQPDYVTVNVKESRAYAVMEGATLSKIRIRSMRLDALLTDRDSPLSDDVRSLAGMIGFSRGELTLTERDINDYFATNETSGFSGLAFDLHPDGFSAKGLFTAQMWITIRIRLGATGRLGLGSDGVFLRDVKIYTENVKQPDLITDQILDRINPLITWDRIPFKVEFKDIVMDDEQAMMTGYPAEMSDGESYTWRRGDD